MSETSYFGMCSFSALGSCIRHKLGCAVDGYIEALSCSTQRRTRERSPSARNYGLGNQHIFCTVPFIVINIPFLRLKARRIPFHYYIGAIKNILSPGVH